MGASKKATSLTLFIMLYLCCTLSETVFEVDTDTLPLLSKGYEWGAQTQPYV